MAIQQKEESWASDLEFAKRHPLFLYPELTKKFQYSGSPMPIRIRFTLKSYDTRLLSEATENLRAYFGWRETFWENQRMCIKNASYNGKQKTRGPVPLPTKRRTYCVLRSPHVNKDSREHFEIKVHKRLIEVRYPMYWSVYNLYQNLRLPAGVNLEFKILELS